MRVVRLVLSVCFLCTVVVTPVSAKGVAEGLAIGTAPPQASATALLELPTVYALPGSPWYWLKHVWEEVQLFITIDDQQRAELLLQFSQERLAEGYQSLKSGQADKAIQSLSAYQQQQQDLATSLDQLDQQDVQLNPFLIRLKEQLGLQQALEDFAKTQLKTDQQQVDQISLLLEVRPIQTLVFTTTDQQYLLGASEHRDAPQASSSAQASTSASPSAQPTHEGVQP